VSPIRVGTRGSVLALWQTNWVCARLRELHPELELEQVVIRTHGDETPDAPFDASWPAGAFVSALERALRERRIDLAVHSCKDLPTASTAGISIAAVPEREVVHDVLLTADRVRLDSLPRGMRIGTGSPRRAAQLRRLGHVTIVPLRGNVPTRVEALRGGDLDGVVLAAAGLKRLGLTHPYAIELPAEQFVPAAGQGALAVQARDGDTAVAVAAELDDAPTRMAITAERSFLEGIEASCHTPTGAWATVRGPEILLRAQLFSDDYARVVEGAEEGRDPVTLGRRLADRLKSRLSAGA
jgi:hydroxymethylbilane synthase